MMLLGPVMVQPIGYVKNSLGRRSYDQWRGTESMIVVSEEYKDALYRLDEYNYIQVLFYLHEMTNAFVSRIHPTGNPGYPLMGAFSTRTPNRPSRIALTLCKLLSIQGNVLRVKELDAYDSSPVLDLKPYSGKCVDGVKVPKWIDEIRARAHVP